MRQLFNRLPHLVRKAILFIPIRFSTLLTQLLTAILLARVLGVSDFGAYSYAMAIGGLFVTLCSLGLTTMSTREIATYFTLKDSARMRGYITLSAVSMLIGGAAVALILYAAEASGRIVLSPGWALVFAMVITQALTNLLSSALSGMQYILSAQLLSTLPRAIGYVLVIWVLHRLGFSLTPASLFALYAVLTLPMILMLGWKIWKVLRTHFQRFDAPVFETRAWFFASVPIALQLLSNNISGQVDVIMLANLTSDYEVGLYRAAFRIASLGTTGALIAISVLRPMLARVAALNDHQAAQRLLALTAGMSLLLGGPLWLMIALFSQEVLGIFSAEFVAADTTLQWLLLGHGVNMLTGPAAMVLMIYKFERYLLYTQLAGLALNIVLNYSLISWIGLNGAAIATAISMALVNIAMLILALRKVDMNPTVLATWELGRQWLAKRRG